MRVGPVSTPEEEADAGAAKGAGAGAAKGAGAVAAKKQAQKAAPAKRAGASARKKATGAPARPRLKERYDAEVRADLVTALGLANVMEAPRLEKIVVNMGVGRATQQPSLIEGAVRDLEVITGQKPLVTRARRSIAGFKLREGMNIGVKVTMRGDRAWEFLDRLIALAIPRIRDFRGLSPRSFDGHGNYTFGVNEQLIFPEVDYDRVDTTRGMDITICTTARTDEQGRAFLVAFGFPFRQEAA
jgi:large subunit ribosomal protein L5